MTLAICAAQNCPDSGIGLFQEIWRILCWSKNPKFSVDSDLSSWPVRGAHRTRGQCEDKKRKLEMRAHRSDALLIFFYEIAIISGA